MARTATARRAPQPAAISDQRFDEWQKARTERAHTIVAYTSIADLYADFCEWVEFAHGADEVPDEPTFEAAVRAGYRIDVQTLRVRPAGRAPGMAPCASLHLLSPIRAAY